MKPLSVYFIDIYPASSDTRELVKQSREIKTTWKDIVDKSNDVDYVNIEIDIHRST